MVRETQLCPTTISNVGHASLFMYKGSALHKQAKQCAQVCLSQLRLMQGAWLSGYQTQCSLCFLNNHYLVDPLKKY